MKYTLPVTLLSLAGAALCALGIVYWGQSPQPAGHPESGIPVEPSAVSGGWEYLIREYDGRLAVFHGGSEEPELVFDVFVHTLPEYDRGQLKQGVAVQSYEELISLLEDYTS